LWNIVEPPYYLHTKVLHAKYSTYVKYSLLNTAYTVIQHVEYSILDTACKKFRVKYGRRQVLHVKFLFLLIRLYKN